MFKMAITKHQNIKSKKKGGGKLLNALNDFEIRFRNRTEALRKCINSGQECKHNLLNETDRKLFTIFKNHILDEGLKQKINNLLNAVESSDTLTTYLESRPNKAISLNVHVNPYARAMLNLIGEIRSYYEKEYNKTTSQKSVRQNNVRQNNSPNVRQNNSFEEERWEQYQRLRPKAYKCPEMIRELEKWIENYDKRVEASVNHLRSCKPGGNCLKQYIAPNQEGELRNKNYLLNDGDYTYFDSILSFINNPELDKYIRYLAVNFLKPHLDKLEEGHIKKGQQLVDLEIYVKTVNLIANNIGQNLTFTCGQN